MKFRQFISSCLAITLAVSVILPFSSQVFAVECTAAPQGNLIVNPGLEQGGANSADSWTPDIFGTDTATLTITNNSSEVHGGLRAAKIETTSHVNGDAKWVHDPVSVTPGEFYTFTDCYKSTVVTSIFAFYTPTENEAKNPTIAYLGDAPVAADWMQFSVSFQVPQNVSDVRIVHVLENVGSLLTDDYSLVVQQQSPIFEQGMVTLTFDDGWKSIFDNAIPVLNAAGLKSTQYIYSNAMNQVHGPVYMDVEDIQAMYAAGHDIGAHSRTHEVDLSHASPTVLHDEVFVSLQDLLALTPAVGSLDSFAYPFGGYNETVINEVDDYFKGARTVEPGYNFTDTNPYQLKIQHVTNLTTVQDVQGWIDTAVGNKTWLILMFHEIVNDYPNACEGGGTTNDFTECSTTTLLSSITDYLVQNTVKVVTMSQGLNELLGGGTSDTTKPTVTQHEDIIVPATSANGAEVEFTVTATDDTDPSPTVTCNPASASTFAIATTTVSCTATDASNNVSDPMEFLITVFDGPPVIAPHDSVTAEATSANGAIVNYVMPEVSDVDPLAAECLPALGTVFAIGSTPVTCTAGPDTGGNFAATTTFDIIVADTIAPAVSISPVAPVVTTIPEISFTITDVVSSNFSPECKVNDGIFGPCQSPFLPVISADGAYTVTVQGQDSAGNLGSANINFTFDATAPSATITYSTTAPTNQDVTVTLVPNESITVTNNGGALTHVFTQNGEFTFEFTDLAGNEGTAIAQVSNIDKAAPLVDITTVLPQIIGNDDVEIEFTTDAGTTLTCDLNGSAVAPCTSPVVLINLAQGAQTFKVTAQDAAGNTATDSVSFTVDTVSPAIAIADIPNPAPANLGITFTVIDETETVTECKVDEEEYALCASPYNPQITVAGNHTVSIRATDAAGNTETELSDVFAIDFAPIIDFAEGDDSARVSTGADFDELAGVTATDAEDGDLTSVVEVSGDVDTSSTTIEILSYTVADSFGNITSKDRTVIVSDLLISGEQSGSASHDSITVNWTTSHPATSRVLWGVFSVSNASTTIAGGPDYGYANSTEEDTGFVTDHTVTVNSLTANTTYYFRPVSHGSPETLGDEISVTTGSAPTPPAPTSIGGGGGSGGGGSFNPVNRSTNNEQGRVLGETASNAHPDGALILNNGTIYLVVGGTRRGFRTPEEFFSYGYKFSQAVPANQADMGLPEGNILKAMAGSLVLDSADDITVYTIGQNGIKIGFTSESVFKNLGYNFGNLLKINLSDYSAGPVIDSAVESHPEGTLILDNTGTVWWIIGGKRMGFESEQVFHTYGFTFGRVVAANQADINLPAGEKVKFRDGTLINDNGTIYVISNSKKLGLTSFAVFLNRGYSLTSVISADLAAYEHGENLE